MTESSSERPTLKVIRGDATPEEIAVLVALAAARGGETKTAARQRSLWSSPGRQTRPSLRPGNGAWRASTLPR